MTEYVVLLPGNESTWASATEEQKAEMYAMHGEFARRSASGATRSPAATS